MISLLTSIVFRLFLPGSRHLFFFILCFVLPGFFFFHSSLNYLSVYLSAASFFLSFFLSDLSSCLLASLNFSFFRSVFFSFFLSFRLFLLSTCFPYFFLLSIRLSFFLSFRLFLLSTGFPNFLSFFLSSDRPAWFLFFIFDCIFYSFPLLSFLLFLFFLPFMPAFLPASFLPSFHFLLHSYLPNYVRTSFFFSIRWFVSLVLLASLSVLFPSIVFDGILFSVLLLFFFPFLPSILSSICLPTKISFFLELFFSSKVLQILQWRSSQAKTKKLYRIGKKRYWDHCLSLFSCDEPDINK